MKWWLPGGVSVLLGCGALGAWAEELQWRPAGSTPPANVVRTNYDARNPADAQAESGKEVPSFPAVSLDRPPPLVRAQKADMEASRPLPAGPQLLFAEDKKDQPKTTDTKKEPRPTVEIVPNKPRVLDATPRTVFDENCYGVRPYRTGAG